MCVCEDGGWLAPSGRTRKNEYPPKVGAHWGTFDHYILWVRCENDPTSTEVGRESSRSVRTCVCVHCRQMGRHDDCVTNRTEGKKEKKNQNRQSRCFFSLVSTKSTTRRQVNSFFFFVCGCCHMQQGQKGSSTIGPPGREAIRTWRCPSPRSSSRTNW